MEEVRTGIWKRGGRGNCDQVVKTNHKKETNTTKSTQRDRKQMTTNV